MSIGPKTKESRGIEIGFMNHTKYIVKETFNAFFIDPVHYLFYGSLSLTIIGLLLGRRFQWQLYAAVILLGAFKMFINKPTNAK
jgi:hypothetical protein